LGEASFEGASPVLFLTLWGKLGIKGRGRCFALGPTM
jgi:hypothetical protein